jgi:hypothetical protein
VRALIVVAVYGIGNGYHHLLYTVESHILQQLFLMILLTHSATGLSLESSTLWHADVYAMRPQDISVGEAGVLYATIRVMYDVVLPVSHT